MTLAAEPLTVRDATTLTPSLIAANLRRLSKDIQDNLDQRYSYSEFVLSWDGQANTDPAAENQFKFTSPLAFEIVGVELVVYAATGVTGVTLSATGTSGWESVTATPAGATTRARSEANFVASCAASTPLTFTLSIAGTGTLVRCYAVIHIRADRGNAGASHAGYSPSLPGQGDAVVRADLNTEFTNAAAAVTRDGSNDKCLRIEVRTRRGIGTGAVASTDADFRIPATARRVTRLEVGAVTLNTSTVSAELIDETPATIGSAATVTGAGASTLATAAQTLTDTQSADDATSGADDYLLRFSRTGTDDVPHAYAVLFWT